MTVALAAEETYVPMIREGRVWEYSGYSQKYNGHAFHYMKFDGTETVNKTEYHRFVHFKTLIVNGDGTVAHRDYSTGPVYYLREEPGKVFVLCESDLVVNEEISQLLGRVKNPKYSEFKAYDFTQSEGTVWEYPNAVAEVPITATMPAVVRLDSPVDIDGESCRVQRFEGIVHSDKVKFIEGIGTTFNGCLPAPNFDEITGTVDNTHFASVQSYLNRVLDDKGNVIYQYKYAGLPPVNDGFAPIIEEGKVWEYVGTYFKQPEQGIVAHYMKFDGTVEVNDHVYHGFGIYNSKFYRWNRAENGEDGFYNLARDEMRDGPMWFLREENGKLYGLTWTKRNCLVEIKTSEISAIPSEDEAYGEFKLYDFTLNDNESMNLPEWNNIDFRLFNVVYDAPIMIDGTLRMVQKFVHESVETSPQAKTTSIDDGEPRYIEGIGVTGNGCLPYYCPLLSGGMAYDNSYCPREESHLRSVRNSDGEVIYGADAPVGVDLTITDWCNTESGAIYDLMGRRVEHVLPGSVYVRDGKKFVGK